MICFLFYGADFPLPPPLSSAVQQLVETWLLACLSVILVCLLTFCMMVRRVKALAAILYLFAGVCRR